MENNQNKEILFLQQISSEIKQQYEQFQNSNKSQQQTCIFLVGVAGIPGAGKTRFCDQIVKYIPNSQVVPMDGYHLYLKDLSPELLKIRGNHITFDKIKFKNDILKLKENNGINCKFPSFDHAKKDPIENDIIINPDTKIIIIEGLYLFLQNWGLLDLFNYKIFITCDLNLVLERVIQRHLEAGISENRQIAKEKVENNDILNAKYIQQESVLDENTIKVNTSNNQFEKI